MKFYMTIDDWRFVISWNFQFLLQMGVVATTFLKLDPRPTHKYTIYHIRNFGIEFGQNRLKRLNFFRF